MALTTDQQLIAKAIGYEPVSEDEGGQQLDHDVNYDPTDGGLPVAGSIYRNKQGVYRYYWIPTGGNYSQEEKDTLQGWYDIPCLEELEEYVFDSYCFTPAEDEVEPDHPDSWLRLLNMI